MFIIATEDFLIKFLTELNDEEVKNVVEHLEGGAYLWVSSVVAMQTVRTLMQRHHINQHNLSDAFMQLIDSGSVEFEEEDIIRKTMSQFKHAGTMADVTNIYLRHKTRELKRIQWTWECNKKGSDA